MESGYMESVGGLSLGVLFSGYVVSGWVVLCFCCYSVAVLLCERILSNTQRFVS